MGPKSKDVGADGDAAVRILDGTDWAVSVFVLVGSIVCGPVVG